MRRLRCQTPRISYMVSDTSFICLVGFLILAGVRPPAEPPDTARAQAQPPADLVLINGTVLTVNASDEVAQAVAVKGGKIAAVGTTEAIRSPIGPATAVLDPRGPPPAPRPTATPSHFSGN